MVDWSLARRVARLAAGSDPADGPGFDVRAGCLEMEPYVAGYTRLVLTSDPPPPEALRRADWADANLDSLARLLDPVADRVDERLGVAGPLAGPLRTGAAAALATEAGLIMGYISQRVLGQYDVSLLGAETAPRLLFVAPNLAKAVRELDVDAEGFGRWICAHELTHVFQFQGVSWLRDHLRGLLERYLATVDMRIEGASGGEGGRRLPSLPDPRRIVEQFREGGLVALVQTGEQRALLDGVQATMAVIEGYSEHVMDAIAAEAIPDHEALREAMERRRASRSAPERLIERLLGFDLKLRQYAVGKTFCDAVVARRGMDRLNVVWRSPASLPTPDELRRPDAWLERTDPRGLKAA